MAPPPNDPTAAFDTCAYAGAPPRRARIAVLASGGGSNLGALLEHLDGLGERRAGDVVLVASNRADAGALDRARDRRLGAAALHPRATPTGPSIEDALAAREVDLVVLAGYLRLLPPEVVRRWVGRIVNVHPALLPAFGGPGMYGHHVHAAVVAAGSTLSGPTVHFVDEVYDHGRVIAQWPVPVLPDDTAESLAARVLRAEHFLFPRVIDAVAGGRIGLGADGRVWRRGNVSVAADVAFTLTSGDVDSWLGLGCRES